jgi:signal transduction histidine kinase
MRKKQCLLFIAKTFIFILSLSAQNTYTDSLKLELQRQDLPDSVRMKTLICLGDELQYSDASYAKKCFSKAYELAKTNGDNYQMGESMSGFGKIYYSMSQFDSAKLYFLLADSFFRKDPSEDAKESVATNKADIGHVEIAKNNYEAAIKNYLESIRVMEKSTASNKWKALGNLYASVATVYHDMEQFDKALAYDLKGLEAHRKEKNNFLLTAYLELYVAGDYIDLKNFTDAKVHLQNCNELMGQVQTADLYQKLFESWGRLYQKSNLLDSAVHYYQKALGYAKLSGNQFLLMDNLRMLGFAYRDMKNYDKSEKYMREALVMVRQLNNKRLEAELLENMAKLTAAQKHNADAVLYYKQYINLSDSLNASDVQKKINEIENKYQASKKRDSIVLLQKDFQVQKADLAKKTTENIALLTGCGMLLLVTGLTYKNFKNKNQLLKQKEELHTRRIHDLEKEHQLVAMQSVLRGQEEERSRLARDLHDGVGGLLSGVKLSLSTMKGNVFISEQNAQSLNRVITQLDQSIAELRRVSHNMMPEALIKFGLREALENYCEDLNLSGQISVGFQAYGMEDRMDQNTEIILYRIVQELLNNVIKHAEAKKVLIQLVREADRFNLTVEDDGKGFDSSEINNGAGLSNVRARTEYLNGNLDIVSQKGEGTSVHIEGDCLS